MGSSQEPANLELILVAVHHGCMGLPQELVDHTMDMLRDDLSALKACSLACRAMFASTRHLIHRILYLITQNDRASQETPSHRGPHRINIGIRVVSCKGGRGLLQYTRQVYIRDAKYDYPFNSSTFCQVALLPHLHYFQSLDQVHTLTIDGYNSDSWPNHYKTHFAHFHPTLTTLTLRHPFGDHQRVLEFALQFPKLRYLCLEWPDKDVNRNRSNVTTPTTIGRHSRRHLRLAKTSDRVPWPMDFAYQLRDGFKFRSVELDNAFGDHGQRLLDVCGDTIESLTITQSQMGFYWLGFLKLTELTVLRRLTFRSVHTIGTETLELLPIKTITSPVFSEFVLEFGGVSPPLQWNFWRRWREIDRFLEERFTKHVDFRFVIRTGELPSPIVFQGLAVEALSLLASRGCIYFERSCY